MKKSFLYFVLLVFISLTHPSDFYAQNKVDHWETIFDAWNESYYLTGVEPTPGWNNPGFAHDNWEKGVFAIGDYTTFGKCNDCIKISDPTTLYVLTHFNIVDTSAIANLMLFIEFSDGFVAYVNGIEVSRANLGVSGSETTFDQPADSVHNFICATREFWTHYEPEYYSGYVLGKDLLNNCLKNGDNLLALEIHNKSNTPDNFGFYGLLYAGMKNRGITYQENNMLNNPFPDKYLFNCPFPIAIDSTDLPIIYLTVPSNKIPDNPRVNADMRIIDNGKGKYNHPGDAATYTGKITIERRGSSSQIFPKHSYGLSTVDDNGAEINVPLLGLPEESDWIFKGEFQDRTLIRDVLSFQLSRNIGEWAPRTRFFELFINNENMGLFTLVEKIKRDSLRVDIAKLLTTDNSGIEVSGGYILKIDKTNGSGGNGFLSKYKTLYTAQPMFFQYDYPNDLNITPQQKLYIENFMSEFETTLRSKNYKDINTGYRNYISTRSFIDFMIINELARNIDGYRLSTFMYKEKDDLNKKGKLHMGPIWDFNLAYGYSGDLCEGTWSNNGWSYDYNTDCPKDSYYVPFWYDRLLQDKTFRDEFKARWDELRKGPLHQDSIMNFIDHTISGIQAPIERNFNIWNNAFKAYIWPVAPKTSSHFEEISYLKTYIINRLKWLDNYIPEIHSEVDYATGMTENPVKAYPNPFTNEITFEYPAIGSANVQFIVYNITGQKITTFEQPAYTGINVLIWNGKSLEGFPVKPGLYLYKIAQNNTLIAKGIMIKN